MLTRRIIPDISFNQSTAATPGVTFEMRPRNFPGSTYSSDPSDTQSVLTTSANVTVFTDQVFIRARARQMAFRNSLRHRRCAVAVRFSTAGCSTGRT
jgi:hypothetical protein